MGKIGDLIVRLQLKHEDYEKGLKKAEKDTKGFGASLGKIKGIGLAVWAAIGGAVLKVASDMVKATNVMEDKWAMFTSKAKAGWDLFVRTLINGQWSNFTRQFKETMIAAQYLTEALDASTEVENSIKLQKSAMAEELAALEVLMRDQTKTYKERAEAAQKYIDKVSPIYDQEIKRLEDLKKAYMVDFGKGVWSKDQMTNPAMMKMVEDFLVKYGQDTKYELLRGRTLADTMKAALVEYDVAPKTQSEVKEQRARKAAIEQLQWLSESWGWGTNTLLLMGQQYEQVLNGESVTALVDSIANFNNALGAKDSELKKIYGILNSATAQIQKGEGEGNPVEEVARTMEELVKLPAITAPALQMEFPDIIPDDWLERNRDKIDAALAEAMRLQEVMMTINNSINEAIAGSLVGATQAIVDCLAGIEGADAKQVLAALLEPFASTMTQLGEMLILEGIGIEAFKESLASLNPAVAIGAGVALVALGAALAAGISALGRTASGTSSATTSNAANTSSNRGVETYEQEITVHVVGEIAGDKIVLAGQKTLNKWNR